MFSKFGGGTSQVKIGEVTPSTVSGNKSTKVVCGFKPQFVAVVRDGGSETVMLGIFYIEDMYTTKYDRVTSGGSSFRNFEERVSPYSMVSIDNDGFTFGTAADYSKYKYRYYAIG